MSKIVRSDDEAYFQRGSIASNAYNKSSAGTLSSNRFTFTENPDEEETAVDCINKSSHLFAGFKTKPPTLEEALKSMEYGDENAKKLSDEFFGKAKEKLEGLDAPGLTF